MVAVATVIYLGTFRDYFSLTQYAAVAPKGDIPVQGESESTGRVNQAYNLSPLKKPYEIGGIWWPKPTSSGLQTGYCSRVF